MPTDDLSSLKERFIEELGRGRSVQDLEEIRVKYTGRKGVLTERLKTLGGLAPEERKKTGALLNELKIFMEKEIAAKRDALKKDELRAKLAAESIDITLPGNRVPPGRPHPVTSTMNEIIDFFSSMGFSVEEGPEVELDFYNFEALNIPKHHPARDMQDTFYLGHDMVLRTHTSPVQVRVMQKKKPPLRFIAPGKVYRCDADISHTPMFHQIEGLMVDRDISFSHLKAVLEAFIHKIFSPEAPVRFRPSYFPFTEPSAEVDMGCIFCKGQAYKMSSCKLCKGTGWIEILGAGMVNPRVFEMVGCDPNIYTGFAFGMGMERITLLKYGIEDIRLLFENDIRFLEQF